MRILVIEDDNLTRLDLEGRLSDLGHSVMSAGDPGEAMSMGLAQRPQVVISDWKLGSDIDGLGVCNQLLSHFPGLYIVMMTGASRQELLQNSFDTPLKSLLSKPVVQKDLEGAIQRASAKLKSVEL